MVDNLDLIEGSDGWAASWPRRGLGQRQHRLGIRQERRNSIPSMRTWCGMMESADITRDCQNMMYNA